ncbi:hypothetical protein PQO03_03875 [Lentisphaera profundi]|uniref:Uncharacterized protein n=1 Tax=Lentisphaera profundi TaxID=1658616 RepID=A0ABY7VUX3_9BACT|nr:hypothetical protein [Lentisphaera profundi]WDE97094.1 hypothetical protein PQO03_03875 [Lentisphaera profundi]
MKKILLLSSCLMLASSCVHTRTETRTSTHAPKISSKHNHTHALLDNSLKFIKTENAMIDKDSGYPLEGWNQDPERGLFLRSFTQLSAIGEWLELSASISAGYCDSDYLSREQALIALQKTTASLLADQKNPALSAKGLLVNFLDLGNGSGKRVGPLGEKAGKAKFIKALDGLDGEAIWNDLVAASWLEASSDGSWANIRRSEKYGTEHFKDNLAKYEQDKYRIMEILDQRVVNIIFGDNVNLTASVAKAIGALLHPSIKERSEAIKMRQELQVFLDNQAAGYDFMLDKKTQSFLFGWDATNDTYTGWDVNGVFKEAHMNSFINEFRGPWTFTVLNYNLDIAALANAAFKIKPYPHSSGKDLYSLATWDGSAFQFFGLTNFMKDQETPAWNSLMQTAVDAHLDFAEQNQLPGFLSESYTGNKTEYTGHIGLPTNCLSDQDRITDAASLYSLGVASMYRPREVEQLLKRNWETISLLLTDHGPWEGYNTTQKKVIEFQTSAHTLALILGLINSAPENMQRYLDHRQLNKALTKLYAPGEKAIFAQNKMISAPQNQSINFILDKNSSLSNGQLILNYKSASATKAVLTFQRSPNSRFGLNEMSDEIYLSLKNTNDQYQTIAVNLPAVASLQDLEKISIQSLEGQLKIEIKDFSFQPFKQ